MQMLSGQVGGTKTTFQSEFYEAKSGVISFWLGVPKEKKFGLNLCQAKYGVGRWVSV